MTNTAQKKGGATITLNNYGISSGTEFFFDKTTCRSTLVPRQKCTITFEFRPTGPGGASVMGTVLSNAANGTQTFQLMGVGTCPMKKGVPVCP